MKPFIWPLCFSFSVFFFCASSWIYFLFLFFGGGNNFREIGFSAVYSWRREVGNLRMKWQRHWIAQVIRGRMGWLFSMISWARTEVTWIWQQLPHHLRGQVGLLRFLRMNQQMSTKKAAVAIVLALLKGNNLSLLDVLLYLKSTEVATREKFISFDSSASQF